MLKIEKTIKEDWKNYTPSEQKIANFFLNHLHELPFETAASIGKRVAVSPMTVGRYIKKLGYSDLRDIKAELRASGDKTWNESVAAKVAYSQAPLKAKIEALVDVYKIPQSAGWPRIVSLLAHAPVVHVAQWNPAVDPRRGWLQKMIWFDDASYFRPDCARDGFRVGDAETVRETDQPCVEIQSHAVRRHHLRAGVHQRVQKFQHTVRVIQLRGHVAKCFVANHEVRQRHAPRCADAVQIVQTPAPARVQKNWMSEL